MPMAYGRPAVVASAHPVTAAQSSMTKGTTAVVWRRLDAIGLERFEMLADTTGWTLRGTILLTYDSAPFEARYVVSCDPAWVTRSVAVDLRGPEGGRAIRLTSDGGRWHNGSTEYESVRGCVDVDLGWTPSTNALPIRRLDLADGQSETVAAAWVRFPELTLERLPQEYRRLAHRRYRYSSAGGQFVAELEVDDDGLVTTYGQIWSRA
jgi:hypothetical protein